MKLASVIEALEAKWPLALSESWDAPGLVAGDLNQVVSKVLFTVDVTAEVILEAQQLQVDLIVAHHPFLLRPVQFLATDTSKGFVISEAIKSGIAIYAAHTNADNAKDGVSEVFAKALDLTNLSPLVELADGEGAGRIGFTSELLTLGQLAEKLAGVLPQTTTGVRVAGDFKQVVSRVAVCGGAGDSFIETAYQQGADVYITSDLRHHVVQEAIEKARAANRDFSLIDVSHWASESLWLKTAADHLSISASGIAIEISAVNTDPWQFAINS